jgi:hypothetical protein
MVFTAIPKRAPQRRPDTLGRKEQVLALLAAKPGSIVTLATPTTRDKGFFEGQPKFYPPSKTLIFHPRNYLIFTFCPVNWLV